MEIGWRMSDAHPAEAPISLSYASDPQSDWQQIADWQSDTGRYMWTADSAVPPKA